MKIVRDWRALPEALRGGVYAIGNFDGVHLGHQAILRAVQDSARAEGVCAGVLTFEPHPRSFFQPESKLFLITPLPLKLEALAKQGVDGAVVAKFDAELASLNPREFVTTVLVDALNASSVIVGENFVFGRDRQGDSETLIELGEELGFGVLAATHFERHGIVSSSRIREALRDGKTVEAAELLGRWWRVRGIVQRGAARGKGLGAPTANISLLEGQEPRRGVYASRVWAAGAQYDAASYFGGRPTFGNGPALLESTLFAFDGDLYGQTIEVELIVHLRDDEKFESGEELAAQMAIDCRAAREALAQAR